MSLGRTARRRAATLTLLALTLAACASAEDSADTPKPAPVEEVAPESTLDAGPENGTAPGDGTAPEVPLDTTPVAVTIPASLVGDSVEAFEQTLASYLAVDPFDLQQGETTEWFAGEDCLAALAELDPRLVDESIVDDLEVAIEDFPEACLDDYEALDGPDLHEVELPEITVGADGAVSFVLERNVHQRVLASIALTLDLVSESLPHVQEITVNDAVDRIRIAVNMPAFQNSGDEEQDIYGIWYQAQLYRAFVGLGAPATGEFHIELVDSETGAPVKVYTVETVTFTNLIPVPNG